MQKRRLKYINEYEDRHGKWRARFRRKSRNQDYAFKHLPGTQEFMDEYNALLNGQAPEVGLKNTIRGSFTELIANYYKSNLFVDLGVETKKQYMRIIDRFRVDHGEMSVKTIKRKHIQDIINGMADTPSAANNLFKKIRILMNYAMDEDIRTDNPCDRVRMFKTKTEGHHTWTDMEIAAFEKQHPLGTQAYLALTLLLYTGTRISEVVKLGRQSVKNGTIAVQHLKGSDHTVIPIHPILAEALDRVPKDRLLFICHSKGSYSAGGFGSLMRKWCDQAGLSHCSAHGLKKSICVKLAEAGCSDREIMSITGHKSEQLVSLYTRQANQKTLAHHGITKIS